MLLEETPLRINYRKIRKRTIEICQPLSAEDHVVQPVDYVSPPKWHLAHTTWFFETFILIPNLPRYRVFNENYSYLFNSYYESAGPRVLRADRGNLTRPTVDDILDYREYVDDHMERFLEQQEISEEISTLLELGFNHEQQHQELLLYDIKYILGHNPIFPVYKASEDTSDTLTTTVAPGLLNVEGGLYDIGFKGNSFRFDNEQGRHQVYVHDFGVTDRLVTNEEYLEFILEGGYQDFRFWLSEGWEWVKENDIKAPLYWHLVNDQWHYYSLNGGLKKIDLTAPVMHVSFYEADAFAKWKGLRLPTEFEWEIAAMQYGMKNGNFMESGLFETVAQQNKNNQLLGDVWEWTNSAYLPYPFYKAPEGAVGEYNGKFMINQMVLRGGSCATPQDHIRITYRNFFHPHLRWMFSGFRLAVQH